MQIQSAAFCRGFNPRARVGRDITALQTGILGNRFNPRARVGRDPFIGLRVWRVAPFQSTRPRGARRAH